MDSHPHYRPNTIKLHTLKKFSPNLGYFFVQREPIEYGTLIQRLNENFEIKKSARLLNSRFDQPNFDAYSIDYESYSTCRYYNVTSRRSLYCLLLDWKLETRTSVVIKYEEYKNFSEIQNINIKNTPDGGALIVFALKVDHRVGIPIYLQRVYSDGRVSEPREFGKVKCIMYGTQIFEMNHGVYCVCVTCDEMVHTKCIKI